MMKRCCELWGRRQAAATSDDRDEGKMDELSLTSTRTGETDWQETKCHDAGLRYFVRRGCKVSWGENENHSMALIRTLVSLQMVSSSSHFDSSHSDQSISSRSRYVDRNWDHILSVNNICFSTDPSFCPFQTASPFSNVLCNPGLVDVVHRVRGKARVAPPPRGIG